MNDPAQYTWSGTGECLEYSGVLGVPLRMPVMPVINVTRKLTANDPGL